MSDPFIYNDEVLALSALNLPDNAVVFDVGCSYGEYSLEVAKKMNGRPFELHCFDPVKDFCDIHEGRLSRFGAKINNIGLSDHKGESAFFRIKAPGNQAAEGCSSICLRPEFITNKWPYEPTLIQLDTLDNYIKGNDIKHIDLMKVDAEGSEFAIFKGGSDMFDKELVNIIQFEYNTTFRDMGIKMADVIDYIYDFEYMLGDFIGGKYVEVKQFIDDYGFHNYYLINNKYFTTL